ncbi:peptidase C15 [Leptothoe spongobia TAU-MAC 1115]|uniref:Peptidase C15 n=1 Tax=Leptothoe spongobia TAU-MAC 1115 TaxID=1967444 RepID=A0A947DJS3_9CYAN|nr:peptidase C15 [Leptothoe spongobia TAU-MAC 1115]
MALPILITSFRPWKAHQGLNSSDVLLTQVAAKLPDNVICLRWLPVNFDLAPMQVMSHIVQYLPKVVICCGMAENRKTLTVEQWGTYKDQRLATPIDLQTLIQKTIYTHISYDAGDFVCNRLYYRVLHHLQHQSAAALFVHVPVITPANQAVLEFDFLKIVDHLNRRE